MKLKFLGGPGTPVYPWVGVQTLAEVAGALSIEPNQLLSCYLASSQQTLVLIA